MKPYTRFRDTCFQNGHFDNIRLRTFLNEYMQMDDKPGIHLDECKQDDVVILIYPDIDMYKDRAAHASICFFKDLNKEWEDMYPEDEYPPAEQEGFIYVREFNCPEYDIDIHAYDPLMVRGVNPELMRLVRLLENPGIINKNKTISILPVPKTSL